MSQANNGYVEPWHVSFLACLVPVCKEKCMAYFMFFLLQDFAGIVEKSELAEKVKQAASQGPEGQAVTVPVGYAFDPGSGMH